MKLKTRFFLHKCFEIVVGRLNCIIANANSVSYQKSSLQSLSAHSKAFCESYVYFPWQQSKGVFWRGSQYTLRLKSHNIIKLRVSKAELFCQDIALLISIEEQIFACNTFARAFAE